MLAGVHNLFTYEIAFPYPFNLSTSLLLFLIVLLLSLRRLGLPSGSSELSTQF